MDGKTRSSISIGALVDIVLKKDQPTGKLTRGHVKRILTNSPTHPHGIKVMLREGDQVGRVQAILEED
ncbi:YwbE family protein [Merdimmobilis hominis]|jgi:uncharacterized repeat protein (TIGR03833 family)|uniref:YwbE family protein n=1 Tax=Merdimmobilis hominis TaxID=2897707 RepID=UPI0006C7E542|nr:YwbE family protein [Merdimmobilis hominis]PWL59455.1 MAG: YwbE family protein [Oscillospiraceae bacterium]